MRLLRSSLSAALCLFHGGVHTGIVGGGLGVRRAVPPLACAAVRSASGSAVAERRNDIRHAPFDKRHYRHIVLANGMRALLVHDDEADKAAAALEVRAGHFCDPPELPGLAHFCEHMLFLGTALEPEEGAFKAYLQRRGGQSNAFTGMEATGYHFSVQHASLAGALERFAAFFSSPLLRADSCEREMRAIDSEYRRNLQSDQRRIFQLVKATSSRSHPFHKFSTGNLETLGAAAEPSEAVRAFYERHYVPDCMQLCVLGRDSLDTLEEMVAAHFGGAERRLQSSGAADAAETAAEMRAWVEGGTSLPRDPGPFSPSQKGSILRVQPVRETRMVRLMWEVEPEMTYARSKVLRLLCSLLSHEGAGSLSWLLTQNLQPPLATAVSASSLYSMTDASVLGISISLTPEGLERYDEVVGHVFSQLSLLSAAVSSGGLPEYLFDERKEMSRLSFDFSEPSDPLSLVKASDARQAAAPAKPPRPPRRRVAAPSPRPTAPTRAARPAGALVPPPPLPRRRTPLAALPVAGGRPRHRAALVAPLEAHTLRHVPAPRRRPAARRRPDRALVLDALPPLADPVRRDRPLGAPGAPRQPPPAAAQPIRPVRPDDDRAARGGGGRGGAHPDGGAHPRRAHHRG